MNAPTTRETADHAELTRQAEAASARLAGPNLNADGFGLQIWGDSLKGGSTHVLDVRGWGYLTGGGHGALGLSEDDGIAAQRAIQAYAVAAWNAVPALLSEIAALRGDLTVSRDDLDQLQAHFRQRDREATQAERQRDELRKALEPSPEMIRVGAWRAKLHREANPGDTWEDTAREVFSIMVAASDADVIATQGADHD